MPTTLGLCHLYVAAVDIPKCGIRAGARIVAMQMTDGSYMAHVDGQPINKHIVLPNKGLVGIDKIFDAPTDYPFYVMAAPTRVRVSKKPASISPPPIINRLFGSKGAVVYYAWSTLNLKRSDFLVIEISKP